MDCPKVYAIYLPQFHRTLHNDQWWGEGFTDWEAVKKAVPLFEGHEQPKIPKGRHYYNLLEKKEMEMQATTANKYGIDGFIFYHYFFGDGRMELEKPAENLLGWKDIDMPFCFSWANQSWIRTWSKISGNVWGEKFENKKNDDDNGMLVEQEYGGENEWEKHFDYLLPFFLDKRYIRINGCPVFIFYSPINIGCIKEMMGCWRKRAVSSGLKGLYLIGYNSFTNDVGFDALMMSEPTFSIRKLHKYGSVEVKNGVRCIDFNEFIENSIATTPARGNKTYFTCACGYDTTPRRGANGECIINRTPKLFEKYMTEILQKSVYHDNAFVAVNAWNEWGEGMYLEPDEDDGYAYLEAIRDAKKCISKMKAEDVEEIKKTIMHKYGARENEQEFLLGKFQYYYKVCSKWIDVLNDKGNIFSEDLIEKNIHSVAIYGFADLGHKLLEQLRKEKIKVEYAIDQYVGSINGDIIVYRPEEELPIVDAIIITAYEPDDIKQVLRRKVDCPLFSIRELLKA